LKDDPHFNEITVFDAKDRRFIEDRCQKGDLVHAEGGARAATITTARSATGSI